MTTTNEKQSTNLDTRLLEAAQNMVTGRGDGRISSADAPQLVALLENETAPTDAERFTLLHIRQNFKWTDAASTIIENILPAEEVAQP